MHRASMYLHYPSRECSVYSPLQPPRLSNTQVSEGRLKGMGLLPTYSFGVTSQCPSGKGRNYNCAWFLPGMAYKKKASCICCRFACVLPQVPGTIQPLLINPCNAYVRQVRIIHFIEENIETDRLCNVPKATVLVIVSTQIRNWEFLVLRPVLGPGDHTRSFICSRSTSPFPSHMLFQYLHIQSVMGEGDETNILK